MFILLIKDMDRLCTIRLLFRRTLVKNGPYFSWSLKILDSMAKGILMFLSVWFLTFPFIDYLLINYLIIYHDSFYNRYNNAGQDISAFILEFLSWFWARYKITFDWITHVCIDREHIIEFPSLHRGAELVLKGSIP